jgi:dTMP kinase
MYLITVEGGDGSGKGEAVRILTELLAQYPFNEVHRTHEPRRHSDLGRLALEAVKVGDKTPLQEAGLFAADRLDHSHTWIKPRLERGEVVVSDRNIHSSIIYQGVVGDLGIDTVCQVNSASMIPDLVVWIDCDPDRAIERIKHATLRMSSDKQEYFETPEIQKTIRQGFNDLFTGAISVSPPFDKCCIVGPILNEGGLDELRQKLRRELRSFFNRRPVPLNVDPDRVDRYLLNKLAHDVQQQTRLPGAPMERTSVHIGWLSGRSPAQWMHSAENEWDSSQARQSDVPSNPLARSSWSILGTLSLMAGSCEIPRLHKSLGPHRMVTQRHTQRLVKWLEEANWIHRQQNHIPFAEGQVFKLRDTWIGFARLTLAMWPFRVALSTWRKKNPDLPWEKALEQVLDQNNAQLNKAVENTIERLHILTSGHEHCPVPENLEQLVVWWSMPPPDHSSS